MQITETLLLDKIHTILEVRNLTEDTYVLKFARNGLAFTAGQYITVGLENSDEFREYSVYSAEQNDFIEILVKELPDGYLSAILKNLNPDHRLLVQNPTGGMVLKENEINTSRYVFIASGTGIAPFHGFIKSYPEIDYTILHGVQYGNEAYEELDYNPQRYVLCTSREDTGNFYGRVSDYLQQAQVDPDVLYYVCGNSNMVLDVIGILRDKGVAPENIRTEDYF